MISVYLNIPKNVKMQLEENIIFGFTLRQLPYHPSIQKSE